MKEVRRTIVLANLSTNGIACLLYCAEVMKKQAKQFGMLALCRKIEKIGNAALDSAMSEERRIKDERRAKRQAEARPA